MSSYQRRGGGDSWGRGDSGASGTRGGDRRRFLENTLQRIPNSGVGTGGGGRGRSSSANSAPGQDNGRKKELGFKRLLDILKKDPDAAVVELNRFNSEFGKLISQTNIRPDILTLLVEIIGGKLCNEDVNLKQMRNPLLAKVCTPEFMKHLWDMTYKLMQEDSGSQIIRLTDTANDVDKSPIKVFSNLLSFYQLVRRIMPTLAIDLLPGNVKAAKVALKMLRESTGDPDTQAAYLNLETNFTTLESNLQECIAEANLKKLKIGNDNLQSRPSRKTAFTKGETERLYMENPPEDFKTLSVAPTKDELRSEEDPFLRPNIERGSYPSSDVYLDVQFRLLREDFMAPLREGIQDYLKYRHEYTSQKKKMPFGTVRIYRDVRIVKVKLDGDMTVYSLQFSVEKLKNLNWDKSKRFVSKQQCDAIEPGLMLSVLISSSWDSWRKNLPFLDSELFEIRRKRDMELQGATGILLTGSLLCLTSDDFQSLFLATVVFRRLEDLKRGIIDVTWEGLRPELEQSKSYLMMECEVYYEAYRHTLAALKEIAEEQDLDKYPMKKYIVDAITEEVPPPTYLDETEFLMDFGAMYKGALEKSAASVKETNEETPVTDECKSLQDMLTKIRLKLKRNVPKREIAPLDVNHWPSAEELGMDNSQFQAFQSAVTKELSVIQGPPGTGKTYIGLQIAKLFLTNRRIYRTGSPILVVCYTNHALDQFLEGIIDVMENLGMNSEDQLIRIGSRSKSENLAKYGIYARMQDARKYRKFDSDYVIARRQKSIELQDFQQARSNLLDELKGLRHLDGIVDFDKLSVSEQLRKTCPVNLRGIIFGNFASFQKRYSFHTPQILFNWLGMNRVDFNRQNFIPYAHLRKWFKISDRRSKHQDQGQPGISTSETLASADNSNAEANDEGEGEDEYDMEELMAHRMEVFMEMDTTRIKKSEEKKLEYIVSVNSVQKFLDEMNNIRERLEKLTQNPESSLIYSSADNIHKPLILKSFFDDLALINHQFVQEFPILKNKQIFLKYLMQTYYDEGLDLPHVSQELLAKAHNGPQAAEQISISDKWAVYFNFVEEAKTLILIEIKKYEKVIIKAQQDLLAIDLTGQAQLLNRVAFVGLTTTGAAKHKTLLRMMQSPIVIVEEAAEVLESHIVTSITKHCQHLILIGDHKQLRPSTNVYKLAKDYNLDVSLFERLINNEISSCQLRVQHRMRPNICKLLVPTIYKDLENHPSVSEYPRILGVTKSLFFITHNEPDNADDDSASKLNIYEAKFLVKLCRYLILQGYVASQITIITTYLGQMFLLKKLNSQESQVCAGVRITVVDNFQGEENDIILLSLVRSNAKNNIGFLKTDNRICVALSRAKHGMFVIGNMNSLVDSGSSTWRKIRQDLEQDSSIGTQLELKCEVHGDVTFVEKLEDFEKVPEGGCTHMCEKVLGCGHSCQSVCHSDDRDHKEYKCQLPCQNKCPNEHPCKKRCFMDCGKCHILMDKELPCGHINNIECHLPASVWGCMVIVDREFPCGHIKKLNCKTDPATITCHEKVEKELPCGHKQVANCYEKEDSINCMTVLQKKTPKCDHEVEIHCHLRDKVNLWKCRQPCDIQLDCGHTCGKICHVDNDANHENHVCKKICGRKCEYGHTCEGNHECRYSCPNCQVKISRELPCGHTKMLKCYEDINSVLCDEICKKELKCGHGDCSQKCHLGKECLCKVKVMKRSIGCTDVHEFELACYQPPIKQLCTVPVVGKIPAACGHRVMIPCNIENTGTSEEFLKYCEHPCGEELTEGKCGHKCKGNCFSCFQGRIHQKCDEKCGRSLVCGHICKFPCASLCPPCKEKCDFKCEHSKCVKDCGFPCIGCNEPCNWSCSHDTCRKLCNEKCDRNPCDKPCTIPLPCGHSCIGLCGELCPPLCRVCDAEKVTCILFGDEDEPDARFVYLKDCEHIVEVNAMDKHMTTSVVENGVSVKKCPWCTSVIRNCKRYKGILSDGRNDVVAIKKRINGVNKEMENKLWTMAITLQESIDARQPYLANFREFLQKKTYTVRIKKTKKGKHWQNLIYLEKVNQYLFESFHNMMSWWTEAVKGLKIADKFKPDDLASLTRRYENFFAELMNRILPMSQQEIFDFENEFQRISAWQKLYRRAAIENFSSFVASQYYFSQINQYLTNVEYKVFSPSVKEKFSKDLQALDNLIIQNVKTWKAEEVNLRTRQDIFRALAFGAQHWYKCPNGHLYVIADCGHPNQASVCPECKNPIGRGNTTALASGNTRVATVAEVTNQQSTRVIPDIDFLEQ